MIRMDTTKLEERLDHLINKNMFTFAILVYINEYKAQSNCNQDPTFRHFILVPSSGVI